jgi:hypothetical protein
VKNLAKHGLKVFELLVGLPDKVKSKIKELVWVRDPPQSPTDTRNDRQIVAFFKAQAVELTAFLEGPSFQWIPRDQLRWLVTKAAEILGHASTPFVRFLQFVHGKIKAAVGVMIELAMKGLVSVDEKLRQLQVPPFLVQAVKVGADLISRTVGSIGSYVLKLSPQLESVVRGVVDGLADGAGALDEAMTAVRDASLAIAGPSAVGAPRGKRGADAASARERAARIAGAQERYVKAFGLKREKVEAAVSTILGAVSRSFVSFATPLLEQAAALLKLPMGTALHSLRKVVSGILALIPEAGGTLSGIFDVVASLAIPVAVDFVPQVVITVAMDFAGELIRDLGGTIMKMWDDPAKRALMVKSQQALARFADLFKTAKGALDALKAGLDKGLGAMLEGPILGLLVKRLPPGLGELMATAVGAALSRIFDPKNLSGGSFKLDIVGALLGVLAEVRPKLTAFLLENLKKLGPAPALLTALVKGLDGAAQALLGQLQVKRDISALLQGNVIRELIAKALEQATPDLARFLAGEIGSCRAPFEKGLLFVLGEVAKRVRGSNDAAAVFRKGFVGMVPLVARFVGKPLAALLACGLEGPDYRDFRAALLPAVEQATDILGEEANVQKLLAGGFPAVLGAFVKVVSHPVGALLAKGLGDPALGGAIGAAMRQGADRLMTPAFLSALTKKGLLGVLVEVARIAKGPVLLALARLFNDEAFQETLDKSYDELLEGATAENLAKHGLLWLVQKAAYRWVAFALRKGVDLFGQGVQRGKELFQERLQQIAEALQGPAGAGLPPALAAEVSTGLRSVIDAAVEEGKEVFVQTARPCADRITQDLRASLKPAVSCLVEAAKGAFRAGAVSGAKESLRRAIAAFGAGVAAAKDGLQKLVTQLRGTLPAVAELQAVVDAAVDGGKDAFVAEATPCADGLTDDVKRTIGPVVRCIKDAAKKAFQGGALAGVKEALRRVVAAFAQGVDAAKARVGAFVDRFQAQEPALAELRAIAQIAVDSGRDTFVAEANACVDAITPNPTESLPRAVTCLKAAAKKAFAATVPTVGPARE